MSIKVEIREANVKDMESIATLTGELGYEVTSEEVVARLFSILNEPKHMVYIAASANGETLGWIHVYVNFTLMKDASGELGGLVVETNVRNQGIGKLLLNKAEDWALDRGCRSFIVRTKSTRSDAHRFYEHSGYQLWKDQKVFVKRL